ncbi:MULTISPECIES: hypothetical protein [Methylomonas]|uniref:Uncharacterized protein n=1 Tax=Methylomonas koyamae TaxID=702114 RepID=A0A177N8L9_9GAMM|nr:hypothetical protein [Methylomonas koyamae]OAI14277.1 hypothetical protein A1355_00850 [Methylomonas koyamae]
MRITRGFILFRFVITVFLGILIVKDGFAESLNQTKEVMSPICAVDAKTSLRASMAIEKNAKGSGKSIKLMLKNNLTASVNLQFWEDFSDSFMVTYLYEGKEVSISHNKLSTDNRVSKPLKTISLSPGEAKIWNFHISDFLDSKKLQKDKIMVSVIAGFYFSYMVQNETCKADFTNTSLDFTFYDVPLD